MSAFFDTKKTPSAGVGERIGTGGDPVKKRTEKRRRMKREFLKELGLEKEAVEQIMTEHGKDVEGLKQQISTLETEKENLSGQLAEANQQMEDFKSMDIEGIQRAAEEWKTKAEAAEAKAKADVEKLQFEYALNTALAGAKAREPKAVAALLDMDGLKLNGNEIVGLKDQLEKLKTEKDFLFENDEKTPQIIRGTTGSASDEDDAAIRAVMGLPEKK